MGMAKIFIGVVIIVIGVVLWFAISTPQGALTQIMFDNPSARMGFSDAVQGLQLLYFLAVIGSGIGIIIWGSQS